MKPLLVLLSLFLALPLQAQEQQTFDQIVAHIRATTDNKDFDSLASAKKLAEVATVEQLASFLGEESVPVQLCAVQALGEFKKDPAVVLYLGSIKPEIKGAVAKAILGPPLMEMNLPQLAKSLEYGPTDPLFVEPAIEANRLLGTPDCSTRLALYASFDKASSFMKAKALEELLAFETLSTQSQILFETSLKPTLTADLDNLSPNWPHLIFMLANKIGSPLTTEETTNYLINLKQADKNWQEALIELLTKTNSYAEFFQYSLDRSIRQTTLSHWLKTQPAEAFSFLVNYPTIDQEKLPSENSILQENLQDILLAFSNLESNDADKHLSQTIQSATSWKSNFLWIEIKEVIAQRGEALSQESRDSFQTLLAAKTKIDPKFPEQAYPDLLVGGDSQRGHQIFLTEKARCLECHDSPGNKFRNDQIVDKIGPYLTPGQFISRASILRSLIAPEHEILPGYPQTIFHLKDGSQRRGQVSEDFREDGDALYYQYTDKDTGLEVVLAELVTDITHGSPMPSALDNLSHREIRDVVAYLTGDTAPSE